MLSNFIFANPYFLITDNFKLINFYYHINGFCFYKKPRKSSVFIIPSIFFHSVSYKHTHTLTFYNVADKQLQYNDQSILISMLKSRHNKQILSKRNALNTNHVPGPNPSPNKMPNDKVNLNRQ